MYAFENVHHGMACLLMEEFYEFDLCMTKKLIKKMIMLSITIKQSDCIDCRRLD